MELPPSQTNCGAISGDDLNIIDADTLLRLDIALPDHEEQLIFFQGMIIISCSGCFYIWLIGCVDGGAYADAHFPADFFTHSAAPTLLNGVPFNFDQQLLANQEMRGNSRLAFLQSLVLIYYFINRPISSASTSTSAIGYTKQCIDHKFDFTSQFLCFYLSKYSYSIGASSMLSIMLSSVCVARQFTGTKFLVVPI